MLQFVAEKCRRISDIVWQYFGGQCGGPFNAGYWYWKSRGADKLFAEPVLNLDDLLQTDVHGKGIINLLTSR